LPSPLNASGGVLDTSNLAANVSTLGGDAAVAMQSHNVTEELDVASNVAAPLEMGRTPLEVAEWRMISNRLTMWSRVITA
jgi:hypothetical protein